MDLSMANLAASLVEGGLVVAMQQFLMPRLRRAFNNVAPGSGTDLVLSAAVAAVAVFIGRVVTRAMFT